MKLFLDSSVVVAACLSPSGASRLLFDLSATHGWTLVVSPWVLREVRENLVDKPPEAARAWISLRAKAVIEDDELTFDWPLVFDVAKDKPVLCTALACADALLTLDRRDFQSLLGKSVYDLRVLTPGDFLALERAAGRL